MCAAHILRSTQHTCRVHMCKMCTNCTRAYKIRAACICFVCVHIVTMQTYSSCMCANCTLYAHFILCTDSRTNLDQYHLPQGGNKTEIAKRLHSHCSQPLQSLNTVPTLTHQVPIHLAQTRKRAVFHKNQKAPNKLFKGTMQWATSMNLASTAISLNVTSVTSIFTIRQGITRVIPASMPGVTSMTPAHAIGMQITSVTGVTTAQSTSKLGVSPA